MTFDRAVYIWHAAVRHFQGISVEYAADGQVESACRPIGGISWRHLFPRSGSMEG